MNQNLSPKYYPNNKLSKAITNCEQLSSSNRCLVNSKIILWGIRKFKVESLRVLGHPRSNRSDQVACLSKTQVANSIFVFLIKKQVSLSKWRKRKTATAINLVISFLIQNDFNIDLIGLIIKIEENEIKNLLVYFRWKQLYVAAGIR